MAYYYEKSENLYILMEKGPLGRAVSNYQGHGYKLTDNVEEMRKFDNAEEAFRIGKIVAKSLNCDLEVKSILLKTTFDMHIGENYIGYIS